jgi:DNA-binding winged helix-turn-helix (wHTH) protein/TolB-like protein/Tfp pilus assembly protein PilF
MTDSLQRYRFGAFALDCQRRELVDARGKHVELSAKAFDLLTYFLDHPGVVVQRAKLLNAVWPDVVVEENSLTQAVAAVRRALGDGYLVTVRGRGYQLVANVERLDAKPLAAETPAEPPRATRSAGRRIAYFASATLALAAAGGYAGYTQWVGRQSALADANAAALVAAAARGAGLPRVAVLPCANLAPDPERAFFANGIHEEIIDRLTKLNGIEVIARSSMLQYADTHRRVSDIARELDADAVLECTVRYSGDQIAVALIDSASDARLWSMSYPVTFADLSTVFAMLSDIAANIATALDAEYSPAERARVAAAPTQSPQAYASLLRWQQLGWVQGFGAEEAMAFLDRAIEADPEFALAYSSRALGHLRRAFESWTSSSERAGREVELARSDALRALELDPALGKAHAMLGAARIVAGERAAGDQSLDRALDLAPNDADILRFVAGFRLHQGRRTEARVLLERFKRLDPINYDGYYLYMAGDWEGAITFVRRYTENFPTDPSGHMGLGFAEAVLGNATVAERELRLVEALYDETTPPLEVLTSVAYAYGRIGLDADARRVFASLENDYPLTRDTAAIWWLFAYLGIEDVERAYETAVVLATRPTPPFLSVDFEFVNNTFDDPIIDEPRFVELRKKLGLRTTP